MKFKKLPLVIVTVFTILFLSRNLNIVNAQSADDVLNKREDEIVQKHIETIKLDIPYITDDPNLTITFKPVKENSIDLQIDNNGFKSIKSPYKFSTIPIGKHVLDFQYIDSSDIKQTFSLDLIIIPRTIRFDSQQKLVFSQEDNVVLQGNAVPYGSVEIWVISDKLNLLKEVKADKDGLWSIDITQGLECDNYQIMGLVRKDGFSSKMSVAQNISYCNGSHIGNDNGDNDNNNKVKFDFTRWKNDLILKIQNDSSFVTLGVAIFVGGLLLGLIYSRVSIGLMKKKTAKIIVDNIRQASYPKMSSEKEEHSIQNEVGLVENKSSFLTNVLNKVKFSSKKNKIDTQELKLDEGVNIIADIEKKEEKKKSMKRIGDVMKHIENLEPNDKSAQDNKLSDFEEKSDKNDEFEEDLNLDEFEECNVSTTNKSVDEIVKNEDKVLKENEKDVLKKLLKGQKKKRDIPKKKLSREEFLRRFKRLEKDNEGKGPTITLVGEG